MLKQTIRISLLIIALAVALAGCRFGTGISAPIPIAGSGNVISESRPVSGFDAIQLNAVGKMTVVQGDSESLLVTADDNILPLIKTSVRGGTLLIEFERPGLSISAATRIEYTITVKKLTSLEINGAGDISATNLDGAKLDVRVNGAGNIVVAGRVDDQKVVLSGAGRYQAEELESRSARIDINGAGSAVVWASDTLDANISGMGSVQYYGNPTVSKRISGLGSVEGKGNKGGSGGGNGGGNQG